MEVRNREFVEEYINNQDPEGFYEGYVWEEPTEDELRMTRLAFKLFSYEELADTRSRIVDELSVFREIDDVVDVFGMMFASNKQAFRWSLDHYFEVLLEHHLIPEIEELFSICAPSATDDEISDLIEKYCELYDSFGERHELFDQFVASHLRR